MASTSDQDKRSLKRKLDNNDSEKAKVSPTKEKLRQALAQHKLDTAMELKAITELNHHSKR